MVKKHNEPYRLYKRGNIYHAYISFVASNGERIQSRISTGEILPEKAAQFCLNYIRRYEEQIKLSLGDIVEINCEQAFVKFFEYKGQYHRNSKDTLGKLNILSNFFNKNLSEITDGDIISFITQYKGRKNSTINRYLALLSAVINVCNDCGYHVPKIKISKYKLKEPAENIKFLKNWDVAQKIIDRAADHLKPIIYTALYTGMRLNNVLSLRWDEVDFQNKIIRVKVKDRTKDGGKNLSIPMIDKLAVILSAQPRINAFVFNYKGNPIGSIKKSWHTIFYTSSGNLRDPSLPYINFHVLRHTAATWILKATGNLKITQQILGHANINTTSKYAHILDEEKRQALNSVFR